MSTTAGAKGIRTIGSAADFRADYDAQATAIRDALDIAVANFAALPASGNWDGQQRFVIDELTMYVYDTSEGWVPAVPDSTPGFLHLQDVKAANTEGGTATSGAWTKRTLNTEVANTITGASVASDVITLPTGTYQIEASAPAYGVNGHKLRVYRTSGTPATLLTGQSAFAQVAGTDQSVPNNLAWVRGQFTISGSSTVEIQHRVETTLSSIGLGRRSNVGVSEIYAEVIIRKIA